jgi:para-nitrobenzyl esterase
MRCGRESLLYERSPPSIWRWGGIEFRDKFLKTVQLGLVLAAALGLGTWAAAEPVAVDGGSLQGVVADGVRVFKGIPFAAPPVGALRWRAPQAAAAWSGIQVADKFSAVCPQHGSYPPESAPRSWIAALAEF